MKNPEIKTSQPRVLLVEDEKLIQLLHVPMLRKLGCRVDLAENGREVLAKSHNDYALILMDIGLPDIRGTELAGRIKSSGTRVPIIAVTAFDKKEIQTECRAVGIEEIFQKPLQEKLLRKILERFT